MKLLNKLFSKDSNNYFPSFSWPIEFTKEYVLPGGKTQLPIYDLE